MKRSSVCGTKYKNILLRENVLYTHTVVGMSAVQNTGTIVRPVSDSVAGSIMGRN